jgi:hypothetical protein
VAQTATVRWPARTVASVAYCVGRHVQIVPSALARDELTPSSKPHQTVLVRVWAHFHPGLPMP